MFSYSRNASLGSSVREDSGSDMTGSASDASAHEGGPIQHLADESPALLGTILAWLEPLDVVRFSLTSKHLQRLVERDHALWRALMLKHASLDTLLRLPRCLSDQQKARSHPGGGAILHGLREQQALVREAAALRKELQVLQNAPSLASVWDTLRSFVKATPEPFLDSSKNALAKSIKTRRGLLRASEGSAESKAIEKQLTRSKREQCYDVLVIGLDPLLLFAWRCATLQSNGGDAPAPEPAHHRAEIMATVMRASHALAAMHVVRMSAAQRVLKMPATEAGFEQAKPYLPELWKHGNEAVAQLGLNLRANYGRILRLLAVKRLLTGPRWSALAAGAAYIPSLTDVATTCGNVAATQSFPVSTHGFKMRIIDATANLMSCKRSRVLAHLGPVEMVVFFLDMGQDLPSRPLRDAKWGLFEQLKLAEALCNSAWFRKTCASLVLNVSGVNELAPFVTASDQAKAMRFLRERARVISRTPANLVMGNIVLSSTEDTKLSELLPSALADLFLARNVQSGF